MRLRPLFVLLAVQVALGGALIYLIASGTLSSWLPKGDHPVKAAPAAAARFDARGALEWARRQVALGPRPAGSAPERRAAALLVRALPHGRLQDIGGGLRNIVGDLPGRGAPIVLIAHYDTTPVPGYLGANNSAAAVGAVVELARALRRDPAGRAVRFVLTDGEEAPTYPVQGDFYSVALRGSRHDAAHGPRPSAVIVLDFVGQKGLVLTRDQSSDTALWDRLRAAARRAGVARTFPSGEQGAVLDDHTPYLRRGIPAVDLIDFSYACWQKTCDTLDKLDVRSIDAAGRAVLELVRELRRR